MEITERKYAFLALALSLSRGAIYAALDGDVDRAKEVIDLTSWIELERTAGEKLAFHPTEHLSRKEIDKASGNG